MNLKFSCSSSYVVISLHVCVLVCSMYSFLWLFDYVHVFLRFNYCVECLIPISYVLDHLRFNILVMLLHSLCCVVYFVMFMLLFLYFSFQSFKQPRKISKQGLELLSKIRTTMSVSFWMEVGCNEEEPARPHFWKRSIKEPNWSLLKCMLTSHNAFGRMYFRQMKINHIFLVSHISSIFTKEKRSEAFKVKTTIPSVNGEA